MTDITTSTVTKIDDPTLAAIADRVVKTFQLAAVKAAAHKADPGNFPMPADLNSAEQLFLQSMQKMPAVKLQAAAQKGLAAANVPAAQKIAAYGDLAGVNLRSASAIGDQVGALAWPANLRLEASSLTGLVANHGRGDSGNMEPVGAGGISAKGLRPQQSLNSVALRILKVKCVEPATWETGDDEIAVGGLTVDPFGFSKQVGESMVREDFNDGVERVYSPPFQFARFDLTKGGNGEDEYCAIFKKQTGPAIQARHGLTRAQFQQAFTDLGGQGYRLIDISGYAVGGQDLYAAIWDKTPGPAYVAHHAMTRAQYQSTFTDLAKQGYRLVHVRGYGVGGQDLYVAIWNNISGPVLEAHHALTGAQFQKTFDDLGKQGYRLLQMSGYAIDVIGGKSQDLYTGIWEKSPGPAYQVRIGMTTAEYQQTFSQFTSQGYTPTDVSGYSIGTNLRYCAIWQKITGPAWIARHGLSGSEYQKVVNDLISKGYRLSHVDGYTVWPQFPRTYYTTLVLAEKNNGGFADFLQMLWDMVKDRLAAAIAVAIGAAIGTDIFPVIGTAIGALVGWILGELFNLLKSIFGDWVFAPGTVSVTVPTLNAHWPGGTTNSSQGMFQYQGYGATYQLTFDWALVP